VRLAFEWRFRSFEITITIGLPLRPGGSNGRRGVEDAVVDRLSSAGLQDNRSLLPVQVSQVKDDIGEAGKMSGLQTMLYSVQWRI